MSYCFGGELEMTETIQTLKEDIAVLQEKLQKLEDIEKQPRMNLQQEGKYAVVSYHDKVYCRLEGATFLWYIKKSVPTPTLVMVEDAETERLLEGIYYNHIQVKKEKEQRTKTPVEECYKDWWGQYPETGTWDSFDDKRWQGFQAGYEFAYAISTAKEVMEKVQEEQEDNEWKSVALKLGENLSDNGPNGYYEFSPDEWFEWVIDECLTNEVKRLQKKDWNVVRESVKWCEENPDKDPLDWLKPQTPEQVADGLKEAFREAIKQGIIPEIKQPTDELIEKLVEKPPEFLKFELGKTLTDLIYQWWSDVFTTHSDWDMETSIEDLVDQIQMWLPKEQSAAGSQSLGVEDMVEGFNDAIKKIKSKLRNKNDT